MNSVLGSVALIIIMIIIVTIMMFFILRKVTLNSDSSKNIVNSFEPDNTAPKITEMVEFHKNNEKIKYKIRENKNGKNE